MDSIQIKRRFSASARQYDKFSSLHRQIADGLFTELIKNPGPASILDIGCGTGYLTARLKNHFPQAKVVGVDLAPGMLEIASQHQDISWMMADACDLPFADGEFDLIVSNAAYQWLGDLTKAFKEAQRVLRSDGSLAATLFGFNTCQELFQCFNEAKAGALHFNRLPNEPQIHQALAKSFKNFRTKSEQIKMMFKDMLELMTWLKSIGANNLSREGYLGQETLSKAAALYQENFPYLQGIGASFEVIHVYAQK